jgi:RHS repeat-associated protein
MRKYTCGLDLAALSGSGVAPANGRWDAGHGGPALQGAGGISGLLAMSDTNGTPGTGDDLNYVCLYDATLDTAARRQGQAGNVGQLVDLSAPSAAEAIKAHYEYDPYGKRTNAAAPAEYDQPWRFSTKQFDAETGLYYFGRRYYGPQWGRWTNQDPIGEAAGVNLNAYLRNSPANAADPLGQMAAAGSAAAGGCCGLDIGARLQELLRALDARIAEIRKTPCRMARMCVNMVSRVGWDIQEFYQLGLPDGKADAGFYEPGCNTGECRGTLRLYGRCYRANEMNYILWGWMNRACRDSLSSWATERWIFAGQASTYVWTVNRECRDERLSSPILENGELPAACGRCTLGTPRIGSSRSARRKVTVTSHVENLLGEQDHH